LTAWDVNNRTPRFFSKFAAKYWDSASFDNNLDLGEMTLASMSAPEYFEPATISSNVYISGDNVAKSPAFFSYQFVKKQTASQNVRVVAIGSVSEEPSQSELVQYSLTDWYMYLMTENHSFVKNTMDYMLRAIVEQDQVDQYHRFELKRSRTWERELSYSNNKNETATMDAELLISNQRTEIDNLLNQLIYDRMGESNSCYTNSCNSTTDGTCS